MVSTPTQALSALLLRLYPRRRVEGLRITFTDLDVNRDATVARLAEAFRTLRQVDERQLRAVKRYVRHVVVWGGHYTAYDQLGGIHLSSSHLVDLTDAVLASVFVHEATHLRLIKHRIKYHGHNRARIERVCVRQQADFLRKLPEDGGAEFAAVVEQALETRWWTDEAHREQVERVVADNNLPRWLVPLLHRPE